MPCTLRNKPALLREAPFFTPIAASSYSVIVCDKRSAGAGMPRHGGLGKRCRSGRQGDRRSLPLWWARFDRLVRDAGRTRAGEGWPVGRGLPTTGACLGRNGSPEMVCHLWPFPSPRRRALAERGALPLRAGGAVTATSLASAGVPGDRNIPELRDTNFTEEPFELAFPAFFRRKLPSPGAEGVCGERMPPLTSPTGPEIVRIRVPQPRKGSCPLTGKKRG
jgi:hypothetical protein